MHLNQIAPFHQNTVLRLLVCLQTADIGYIPLNEMNEHPFHRRNTELQHFRKQHNYFYFNKISYFIFILYKVVIGLMIPPYIMRLDFKTREELQSMPQTEEGNNFSSFLLTYLFNLIIYRTFGESIFGL